MTCIPPLNLSPPFPDLPPLRDSGGLRQVACPEEEEDAPPIDFAVRRAVIGANRADYHNRAQAWHALPT